MPRKVYAVDTEVRVTATFTVDDAVTDPTTVTAVIRTPGGVNTTYVFGVDAELVKDSTGVYHVDVAADQAGRWVYRFVGTGAAAAAGERTFLVPDSEVD